MLVAESRVLNACRLAGSIKPHVAANATRQALCAMIPQCAGWQARHAASCQCASLDGMVADVCCLWDASTPKLVHWQDGATGFGGGRRLLRKFETKQVNNTSIQYRELYVVQGTPLLPYSVVASIQCGWMARLLHFQAGIRSLPFQSSAAPC